MSKFGDLIEGENLFFTFYEGVEKEDRLQPILLM